MTSANDREEIRLLVSRINETWLRGRPEEVKEFLHPDIVVKGPSLQEAGRGRDACVQGYKDFISQATIQEFKASEAAIEVWENTAIASYSWEMTYHMKGENYHDFGHEVFVFARIDGKWLGVWRALLLSPKS